jgi:hypothetical protein
MANATQNSGGSTMGKLSKKQIEDMSTERNRFERDCSISITDYCEHMAFIGQYETTEPGAPLSDDEWEPIRALISTWASFGKDPIVAIRGKIDYYLAKRNVVRPAPVEVNGAVIEKALDAFHYLRKPNTTQISYMDRKGMIAAANVLLNATRGPVTDVEHKKFNVTKATFGVKEALGEFRDNRIDRILKPKEKTFREKVKDILSRRTNSFPVDVDKISEEIDSLQKEASDGSH